MLTNEHHLAYDVKFAGVCAKQSRIDLSPTVSVDLDPAAPSNPAGSQ